jgi:hypothetical protein
MYYWDAMRSHQKWTGAAGATLSTLYPENISPLVCIFFLWLYSPIQALAAPMKLSISFQLLDLGQLVGLLGWMTSSLQGLYLYTNTEKTHTQHKY